MQHNNGSAKADTQLYDFFLSQVKDIYWAEKKLVKTLPKLADAATSDRLKEAFTNHLQETKMHVTRLEQIFKMLDEKSDATKCPAMAGIVNEGEEIIDETNKGTATRDTGLVFAGQKAEHYEIATYGGLITLAHTLGRNDVAELLKQTLQEEKHADELLTEIAESYVNEQASVEAR